MDIESIGKVIPSIVQGLQKSHRLVREHRLKQFVSSCEHSFRNKETTFAEVEFAKIFSNKFSEDFAFDFLESVMRSHSSIARTAIGHLFIKCQTRGAHYLSRNEATILKALLDLDDLDAQCFIFTIENSKTHLKGGREEDRELDIDNKKTMEWLDVEQSFYLNNKSFFNEIGFSEINHFTDSMEYFFVKRILIPNRGFAGGSLVDIGVGPVGKEFYEILKWSDRIQPLIERNKV